MLTYAFLSNLQYLNPTDDCLNCGTGKYAPIPGSSRCSGCGMFSSSAYSFQPMAH